MNVTIDRVRDVAIVRVGETRLMYPMLPAFAEAVSALFRDGDRNVILDFSVVTYIDSATLGCLMDLYRQATAAGARLKLASVQKRVATMLTMTGAHNFIEVHPDEASALSSFGG